MRTMRNILGIGSVLVLSTVATTAQAQNLLTNGSFERFRGVDSVTQASITGQTGTGVGSGIQGGTGLGTSVNRVTVGGVGATASARQLTVDEASAGSVKAGMSMV